MAIPARITERTIPVNPATLRPFRIVEACPSDKKLFLIPYHRYTSNPMIIHTNKRIQVSSGKNAIMKKHVPTPKIGIKGTSGVLNRTRNIRHLFSHDNNTDTNQDEREQCSDTCHFTNHTCRYKRREQTHK